MNLSARRRIALFHPSFEVPGGGERLCLDEALCLRDLGDDVTVWTMSLDRKRWPDDVAGIPIRVTPPLERRVSDLLRGPSAQSRRRTRSRRVTAALRGYDTVVAYNHPCNAVLGASPDTARKVWQCNEPPRYIHIREANPWLSARVDSTSPESDDKARASFRSVLSAYDGRWGSSRRNARMRFDIGQVENLDHVYAISAFSRDNARRIYGRCGEEVVYPIVSFPEPGRSRAGLDRDGFGVLVQSRLEHTKNVNTVIRGFASFRERHPGAKLHVVGDGTAKRELECLASEVLPEGAATFHGYVDDGVLSSIADRCDVFALLPFDEPFGLVFPEAAARGLLLVGPDHGGPLEILDGGTLGWCVDALDPAALSSALEEIVSLPDAEVDRLRARADAACRSRYSAETVGPQLRRVILAGHC